MVRYLQHTHHFMMLHVFIVNQLVMLFDFGLLIAHSPARDYGRLIHGKER